MRNISKSQHDRAMIEGSQHNPASLLIVLIGLIVLFAFIVMGCNTSHKEQDSVASHSESTYIDDSIDFEDEPDYEDEFDYGYDEMLYFAYGDFSEGKASILIDEEPLGAYIDESFTVLFELSPETPFGYDFNEGYAVVSNINYRNANVANYRLKYNDGQSLEKNVFGLIDASGNYVVMPGEYHWISSVSNGKYIWMKVEASYSGTAYIFGINDVKTNNTICMLNNSFISDYNSYVVSTGGKDIALILYANEYILDKYNRNLSLITDDTIFLFCQNRLVAFDYYGNYYMFPSYENLRSKDVSKHSVYRRLLQYGIFNGSDPVEYWHNNTYDVSTKTMISKNISDKMGIDLIPALGQYFIEWDDDTLSLIDIYGKVLDKKPFTGLKSLKNVDDNLWIGDFQNDYYGVITIQNGQSPTIVFAFEPIRVVLPYAYGNGLAYLGERCFYNRLTNDIIDQNGNAIGVFSPYFHFYEASSPISDFQGYVVASECKNGYFIIQEDNVDRPDSCMETRSIFANLNGDTYELVKVKWN